MATTDTSAPTTTDAATSSAAHRDSDPAGRPVAGLFGTGDHKAIGRLFIGSALVFGLGSLALAALTALGQRSGSGFPDAELVLQFSTLSRVGMAFFFLLPLLIGLAIYVVPLQVGAATVAFPRAVAAAYWTWLLSSSMAVLAWLLDGGPGGSDPKMVDLSYFATGVAVVALLLAAISVATTVITLRTPGMSLDLVPFFSWSMVVAAGIWVLTLPVLLTQFLVIYIDSHYGLGDTFASAGAAGAPRQWQMIGWAFSAPQVFAYAIPVLGIALDAISTLAKARQPQRGLVLTAFGLLGVLSVGAWVQPAFYPKVFTNWTFVVWCVLLGLPFLILLGGVGGVLRNGRPSSASPLLGGILALVALLLGAIAAGVTAIPPLHFNESASAYPEAVQNLTSGVWFQPGAQVGVYGIVIFAAAAGAIAGLAYWGGKITGHRTSDGAGKAGVALLFVGALVYGLPFIVIGFSGRSASLGEAGTVDTLSIVSAAGAVFGVAGLAAISLGLLASLTAGKADDDTWGDGQTLEWATSSPPVRANFGELAVVVTAEPLLDTRNGEAE